MPEGRQRGSGDSAVASSASREDHVSPELARLRDAIDAVDVNILEQLNETIVGVLEPQVSLGLAEATMEAREGVGVIVHSMDVTATTGRGTA